MYLVLSYITLYIMYYIGLYYLAPISTVCLFFASFLIEFNEMKRSQAYLIMRDNYILFIIASMLGTFTILLLYYAYTKLRVIDHAYHMCILLVAYTYIHVYYTTPYYVYVYATVLYRTILIIYTYLLYYYTYIGLIVNYLTYYVIQVTSSLTMKILGGVRNILTVLISVLYFDESMDKRSALGYTIAFIGFVMYTAAKAGLLTYTDNNKSSSCSSSCIPTTCCTSSSMIDIKSSNGNGVVVSGNHIHIPYTYTGLAVPNTLDSAYRSPVMSPKG